ncbi:tyrosine kinase receptor Cad96Ca isoform X2 [Haematobia irritans]|uniref:tyrosine kinase receptor Cad96Ca isoform X2 n=1 Tax=Haematobia irritans TaxID=7368 RepID=UPI003F509469
MPLLIELTMKLILIGTAISNIGLVSCQDRFHLNTPPILVVPDRNWRISENEPVGGIIARIRADDAENDELVFGLESQYNGANVPFRIDPIGGVVYLNESLAGRGGENFFLYVTVTDGQLTAKNEVYINILTAKSSKSHVTRYPPSISNVVHNMSTFLPPFDSLPGVQSIRNHKPNRRPYYPSQQIPEWLSGAGTDDKTNDLDIKIDTTTLRTSSTTRTKLNAITPHYNSTLPVLSTVSPETAFPSNDSSNTGMYAFKSYVILCISIACGIFAAVGVAFGVIYRNRLCAFGKPINKKSKEEMARTSNQNNLSISNLTADSSNSMVLNQWNGPMAYGNRYVPWERGDQTTQGQHLHGDEMETLQLPALGNGNVGVGCIGVENGSDGNAPVSIKSNDQFDHWEFPRHRLKFFNILGEGAFGQVWRCEATDIDDNEGITTVAVKTLKENAAEVEKKDLLSELEVMKTLEPHVNVVRLLGCCTDKEPIFVIIEYVNRGKLQSYLRSCRAERHYGNTHGKSNILTSSDLTSFMYQVAKGMEYLSSRGIIHRDLAARNILITEDHTCKVADFGFARDIIESKVYERKSEGKLPIRKTNIVYRLLIYWKFRSIYILEGTC